MRNVRVTTRETGTVRGTARRSHFSLAIISVTVQLRIQVFWVRSVYFNVRDILPKSGTFPRDTLYNIATHCCPLLGPPSGYRIQSFEKGKHVPKNLHLFCEISQLQLFIFLFISYGSYCILFFMKPLIMKIITFYSRWNQHSKIKISFHKN